MKKILFSMISLGVILTACGEPAEPEINREEEVLEEDQLEEQMIETEDEGEEQAHPQITPEGGLGDTVSVFEQNYGENLNDNDTLHNYQDDYILPMFLHDRAYNISIQFEATNNPRRSEENAMTVARTFIPTDAVEIESYEEFEYYRKVFVYHSDLLAEAFADVEGEDIILEEPGSFIVILEGEDDSYFGLTIATGTNP